MISPAAKYTALFRLFGLLKIPMIAFLRPTILEFDDEKALSRVGLNRRTKNHLGTMYFGALVVGAESLVGYYAYDFIRKRPQKFTFVMKDFHADFLKRAEGDVVFECAEGRRIAKMIDAAVSTGERQTQIIEVIARVPSQENLEVARFKAGLSLKVLN